MKKIAVIALIITMLLCTTALAETFYSRQIAFCNEYVTLRAKPSGSAKAIKQVEVGEVVMAAPYNSEFSYCCYDGKFGYIKNQYLSSNIQPWSEGTFYVTNCKEYISLRTMPMKDADVRVRIPVGARLDAVYYHDGAYNPDSFVYVKYNGQCGFALWRYIAPVYYPGAQ